MVSYTLLIKKQAKKAQPDRTRITEKIVLWEKIQTTQAWI